MFKKFISIVLVSLLVLLDIGYSKTTFILAEDDEDYYDEDYYEEEEEEYSEELVCDSNSSYYDAHACIVYASKKYSGEIDSIQGEINAAKESMEEAEALATKYANEAGKYEEDINRLKTEIDTLKERIETLQVQIAENEALLEELNSRVKNRMIEAQKSMHFNGYLDFVLGSKSFTDLLRRVYGVNAILSKDKADRDTYSDVIKQLNSDKKELEEAKTKLDVDYDDLIQIQAELLVKKQFYLEAVAEAEAEIERLQEEIDEKQESYADLVADTGLINSLGFVAPVHNSRITDTPWYYDDNFLGGKTHLGVDYAAKLGTEIHAPASGVVLRADDSCPTYGSLYNYCGAWIAGGGNQIHLLVSVNGSIYAFMFFHLSQINVKRGDIVLADEVLGKVGSSGQSTGPHCHIEMYYLGDGTLNEYLAMSWNATFYVGRGETAISNRCEIGADAPCILNPINYLPN